VACASGGSREESATPCPLYLYVQEQRIITAASMAYSRPLGARGPAGRGAINTAYPRGMQGVTIPPKGLRVGVSLCEAASDQKGIDMHRTGLGMCMQASVDLLP
jgi:hypothetical protein